MMKAQSVTDIGRIVAGARRQRALTQAQLAHAMGVSQNWISEVEAGKPTAQIGKVLGLLNFLGVRLQTAEIPRSAKKHPKASTGVSLDDIIAAHSGAAPTHPRRKS